MDSNRPGIGHNLQNDLDAAIENIREGLRARYAGLLKRAGDLAKSFEQMPERIETDSVAEKAADLRKLMRTTKRDLNSQRQTERDPYDRQSAAVHNFFLSFMDPLDRAMAELNDRENAWLRAKAAEEERKRREAAAEAQRRYDEQQEKLRAAEAARLKAEQENREAQKKLAQQEEAARRAAAKPQGSDAETDAIIAETLARDQARLAEADLETKQEAARKKPKMRTRSFMGATTSQRHFWDFRILDRKKIPLATLRPYLTDEAIAQAVRAFVQAGGRKLNGCEIFETTTTMNR